MARGLRVPGREARAAAVATVLLFALLLVTGPRARAATVDNGVIHGESGGSVHPQTPFVTTTFGPGLLHLWYPDWYPATGANLFGDLMWYGTYDYVGAVPAGNATVDTWKVPDAPANGTAESEPGAGKWADDHASTPLDSGTENVIDATTFEVSWSEARANGASFDLTLNYHALPGERTIRVVANLTNTNATTAFDFAYYHAEDLDAGGFTGAVNDANGDGNDTADDTPPVDQSNAADDGPGDPGDQYDERILPFTGLNWYANWPGGALNASGWKGQSVGYITVADAGGQDDCDQTVTPASCGGNPDGRPDLYSGLVSFDTDVDWYVGRWDAASYGPGFYGPPLTIFGSWSGPCITPGFPFSSYDAVYWTWEDIFECDGIYQDSPNHTLVDEDVGVGLLKHFGTVPAGESRSFVFYIGEPPLGADIVVNGGDLRVWPDRGSTYVGSTNSLNATARNGGGLDIASDFTVAFYRGDPDANADGVIDPGAVLLASGVVPAAANPIASGQSYTLSLPWTATAGDIGVFTIYAVADYQVSAPFTNGTVDEIDSSFYEITNNKAFYNTATVPPGSGPPWRTAVAPNYQVHPLPQGNLAVASADLTVEPDYGSTFAGSANWLNATVHNTGGQPINGTFEVAFYRGDADADVDGIIDAAAILLGNTTVAAVNFLPGETRNASVAWTPSMADLGPFPIYAVVDLQAAGPFADGAIDEPNTTAFEIGDNKALYDTAAFSSGPGPPFVTATPPDYEVHGLWPNLWINSMNLTVEPDFGSTYVSRAVWLNATVLNAGGDDAAADFPVGFYRGDPDAGADGVIDPTAILLGSAVIPATASPIPPGGTATASVLWGPTAADVGQFPIYAAVDLQTAAPFAGGAVDEGGNATREIGDNVALYDTGAYPAGGLPPFVTATPPNYEVILAPRPGPPRDARTTVIGGNVTVAWLPPLSGGADYYEIHGGPTPRGIDLLAPYGTSASLTFVDPGAAAVAGEWYYLVRAVNATSDLRGPTSNTAGVFTAAVSPGVNAISLPLEPFAPLDAAGLLADLGATRVGHLGPAGDWLWYPAAANTNLSVGEGYLVDLPSGGFRRFTGFPGSMIRYDGGFGFTAAEASTLAATLTPAADVVLAWSRPAAAVDHYCVERSPTRDGFHTGLATVLGCTTLGNPDDTAFVDPLAAAVAGEWYYLVVPVSAAGANGSTTWSIGVWTAGWSGGTAFGLPLKPEMFLTLDGFAAAVPEVLGLLWWAGTAWVAHVAAMGPDVYDAILRQALGYQMQLRTAVTHAFVGT